MKSEHTRRWDVQVGRGLTNKPFTVYDYIPKMGIVCKRANETLIQSGN